MVQSNRNFIIAYILLVGLPVLGLVGVLKTGRGVAAPISLDGTWTLQADSSRLASLPCGKSLATSDFCDFAVRRNFYAEHNDRTKIHRVRRSRRNHLEGFAVPVICPTIRIAAAGVS